MDAKGGPHETASLRNDGAGGRRPGGEQITGSERIEAGHHRLLRNSIGGSFGNSPTTQFPGNGPLAQGVGVTTAGLGNFDRQDVSMRQEIRVNFTGETTLDNGITVGVLVGLNGENVAKSGSTAQVERAYADFSGKFGQIRLGEADSALSQDCILDPGNVTSNFGVNSPYSPIATSASSSSAIRPRTWRM